MSTIKSMRLHIGLFGCTNSGKSSFLNTITNQKVSIVSSKPGTTTDPVEKVMELKPFGPVLFIDTAGFNDQSFLGKKRTEKSKKYFDRSDVAILISDASQWGKEELKLIKIFKEKKIPFCIVFTKNSTIPKDVLHTIEKLKYPYYIHPSIRPNSDFTSSITSMLKKILPKDWFETPKMVADFVNKDDIFILVIPIDKEAPKNRIILPQQQAIRDILDKNGITVVITPEQIQVTLSLLKKDPTLIITDSQAFKQVFSLVPENIPVTGFSILLARMKGDLDEFIKGIDMIPLLEDGDNVLIMEACSHNPVCNDIGREQIPSGIKNHTKKNIHFDVKVGHDFPDSLKKYRLIIHCGACILNRKEVLFRINEAKNNSVLITNYGATLSYIAGDSKRTLRFINGQKKRKKD